MGFLYVWRLAFVRGVMPQKLNHKRIYDTIKKNSLLTFFPKIYLLKKTELSTLDLFNYIYQIPYSSLKHLFILEMEISIGLSL